jgi:hypothetical protein
LGRVTEESLTPQAKASEAGGGASKLDRLEIVAADATTDASAVAEAGLMQAEGAAAAKVVASRPAIDEVAAGDIIAAEAPSGPAGLEDLPKIAGEVTTEVAASARAPEPLAVVTQAASILELVSSMMTDAPVAETEAGITAGSLFFGATSDPEEASRRAPGAQMVESERDKASPPPRAVTQGASGGRDLAAPSGSGISSQSSASRLQK